MSRPLPPHGTPARYERGCRCPECRAANTERKARYDYPIGRSYQGGGDRLWRHLKGFGACESCRPGEPCYYHDKVARGLISR